MLVNKSSSLSKNYVPQNLVQPDIVYLNSVEGEERLLNEEAAISIEELFYQAKMENIKLYATSGESEHQTGLAIDITNEERYFTEDKKEAKWLESNSYKFGFIVRYPKDKEYITGYSYEPWHLRYVGVEIAKQIYKREIVLEEYLNINVDSNYERTVFEVRIPLCHNI